MAKTKIIQIRVSKNQFHRIKNNALAKGYLTLSAYLRELGLDKDLSFEIKFNEMYKLIKDFKKNQKTSQYT